MRGLIIAFAAGCFAAYPAGAAGYAQKDKAIHHLASVMAYAQLCPRIAMDKTKAATLMKVTGVEPDSSDGDRIVFEAKSVMSRLNGKSEDVICASGLLLYGPQGRNIRGLVHAVN